MHSQPTFRLLVVRLGAMGDILHALPAVTALRLAHPGWEIGWVVSPQWRALLANETSEPNLGIGAPQPLVDRLHLAPSKQWSKRPLHPQTFHEIAALRRELRACRYDAVVDFQGAVRSAAISRMAGAGSVIGESRPREWAARWLFSRRVATRGRHVIEQDLELAGAISAETLRPVAPLLPVDPQAERWCDALFHGAAAPPVALIAPGAGWGAKRWPAERYAAVAAALSSRGMRVLINTGPGEEPLAASIQLQSGGAAAPVTASLSRLIALTRRVALCVGGDTGPLHLACALGRPVVGIYGPTDPGRNGPFGTRFVVLRSPSSRRDHSRRAEPEPGLLTITPESVLAAARALLEGQKVDVRQYPESPER